MSNYRDIMSNQHSVVTYQADSVLEYMWANWLTKDHTSNTPRWMDYPYNQTHSLRYHTLTKEMIYKPLRYFTTTAFNATHNQVTDSLTHEVQYKPIPEGPSLFHDITAFLFILVFVSVWIYLIFFYKEEKKPASVRYPRSPRTPRIARSLHLVPMNQ
jgi:hypothetical protein